MTETQGHEYLYRNRPPWIGTQPDGYDKYEAWQPPHGHESGHEGQYFHGVITYPEPLTLEQVHKWELWPVDRKVRAEYAFWLEGDEGWPGGWLRESYMDADVAELLKHAENGDTLAKAALVLRDAV